MKRIKDSDLDAATDELMALRREALAAEAQPGNGAVAASGSSGWSGATLAEEIEAICGAAVAAHGGNFRAAARALGISHTTLYRYIARSGGL